MALYRISVLVVALPRLFPGVVDMRKALLPTIEPLPIYAFGSSTNYEQKKGQRALTATGVLLKGLAETFSCAKFQSPLTLH